MCTTDNIIAEGPFQPTWDSLLNYRVPAWYEDAKFGIFIHWGIYAVPAFDNEWYPRNMYQEGSAVYQHHRTVHGPQSKFGYKDFIPQFRAEKFDPAHWADLFRRAGARFVVPVAEHHDGFAMYDCSFSKWTAVKMGPRRDVIGELASAVREKGMIFGLSSHRAEHWFFFDGGRKFDSDVNDPRYEDFYGPAQPAPSDWHVVDSPERPDEAFLNDWLLRTCELVDKYQPQLVWFDWWIDHIAFKPSLQKFAAYYYNRAEEWKKKVVINYKHHAFAEGSAVFDIERGQLTDIRPLFWQTDTAVSKNSWGYITHHDYKTAGTVIGDLADIVSKNGALLLNIGPKADGTIPEGDEKILLEIGQWLSVNGDAIYGTRPWRIFGEGPTQIVGGTFNDVKRPAFTSEDIRFTVKEKALYAILLGWPESGRAVIRSLASWSSLYEGEIAKVELLGSEAALSWRRNGGGLFVQLPLERPCEHAFVLRILPSSGA